MATSAEPDDVLDRLVQKLRRTRPIALIMCLAIGGIATLAALELAGRAVPDQLISVGTNRSALYAEAAATFAPEPTDSVRGMVRRATLSPVEGNAAARATPPSSVQPAQASAGKQTMFNEQNFTPRSADNR